MYLCHGCHRVHAASHVFEAPCGHAYCQRCLETFFLAALGAFEFCFVQCCGTPVPHCVVSHLLSHGLNKIWACSPTQYPGAAPVRCMNRHCRADIWHRYFDVGTARCPKCLSPTCIQCRRLEDACTCEGGNLALYRIHMACRDRDGDGRPVLGRCRVVMDGVDQRSAAYEVTRLWYLNMQDEWWLLRPEQKKVMGEVIEEIKRVLDADSVT